MTSVITIDGPSGAGKGTLSQLLAQHLGWHLLDSGALYRLVALAAARQGLDFNNEPALARCAAELDVVFKLTGGAVAIMLEGENVSDAIRAEAVGMNASVVAALTPVREALLARQRDFAQPPGLVADGRDMGTTVFPAAAHKFFLTASADARAQRRYQQLSEKGETVDMEALVRDIQERDRRDQSRATSPLRPAADAVVIDSTSLTIEQVLAQMLESINSDT